MTTITDTTTALALFEEAAIRHGEATEKSDYEAGSTCAEVILKAIAYLKDHNELSSLLTFLTHASAGVRIWAATYLLPVNEQEAVETLEEVAYSEGVLSRTADTTLREWRKGNLKTVL